jgi:curved DNA-binding protein CbpA
VANHYAALDHPDASDRPARFLEIQGAYDVLGDPAARSRYDTSLRPREEERAPREPKLPAIRGPRDRPSLGLAGAKLAHSELAKLGRLRELHVYGIGSVVDLPEPSRASRTAARCGWMLGRAAPIGFILLTLAAALERIQPLLDLLRSLQGVAR